MSGSTKATAPFALTLTQSDIYLDQARQSTSPLYNVGGYMRLGRIDVPRLARAHGQLVQGHQAFGLRLHDSTAVVEQSIHSSRDTALPLHDFSREADPVAAADAWLQQQFRTPFALHRGSLFRAFLLKLGEESYRYAGITHHLAMDGWGFANWARELCRLYDGGDDAVQTLDWRSVATADQDYLAAERYRVDQAYWRRELGDLPPPLFDARYRDAWQDMVAAPSQRLCLAIDTPLRATLHDCAAELQLSPAALLLGVFAAYFLRASSVSRVVFGLPLHNRRSFAQKQMLGVFTSISPLCVDAGDAQQTLAGLVASIARHQRSALRHQRYPIGHMVRDLGAAAQRRGLYDVGFNYLKLDGALQFDGQPAQLVYLSHGFESTPLMLTLWESDEVCTQLQLDYNLAYFTAADADLLGARLLHVLGNLRHNLQRRIGEIDILPAPEVEQLLRGFGDADLPPVGAASIASRFESQVLRTPHAPAASADGASISYAELNTRANRIAHRLRALGITRGGLVGICAHRSLDMLAAVLGILKAGAAYLPLDPAYPAQRLRMILEDSAVQIVLTEATLVTQLAMHVIETQLIADIVCAGGDPELDHNPVIARADAQDLAYVIYTSGSTGRPKGVEICHGSVVALLDWALVAFSAAELARVLACTSLNFDLSVFEMFVPLAAGGEVVIVRDALALIDEPAAVSLINTVPSAMKALLERNAVPGGVLTINLAGEPLPMRLVNSLLLEGRCRRVVNLYGPTEDTVYSTYASFSAPLCRAPGIGRAIAGTQAYVLGSGGELMPLGAIGELHLAGAGLARGYRNNSELTAQKFVRQELPRIGDVRLYKTGDRVRYRIDGELEYLGRLDEQLKLRGFRIELGDVQHALEQLDDVAAACVIADEHASQGVRLLAFVELGVHQPAIPARAKGAQLRRDLRTRLPSHMVPAVVTPLVKLPLTPNGKVDKARLASLESVIADAGQIAPAGATEIALAEIWASLLNVDVAVIGADSGLFDLGGHSLLLARLALNIRESFGVELSLRELFDVVDLRELATRIDTECTVRFIEERMSKAVMLQEGCL
ncbi:MAG: amino acid adenylation domain-containing protein [Rhodanobacteraceae bacterium]|nr:amino acid adenylation domain-containing protein [Rhodanobacteraceae bacterium]